MPGFTEAAIVRTFSEMLQTVPFDRITVSALVKKCGVSHNTFYYHFQDIYDLLDVWLAGEIGKYSLDPEQDNWRDTVSALLHNCRKNKRLIYHVFDSLSRDRLERYLFTLADDEFDRYVRRRAQGTTLREESVRDIADFCRYSFFGFFLKFLWNDMEDDIERSVDTFYSLFQEFVDRAIQRSAPDDPG